MITKFTVLQPPGENGNGWYVPAGGDVYTNHFLYDDGDVHFAASPPEDCSGDFRTKAKAYLASINYYVKHGYDYPHEIYGSSVEPPITSQSTTMEFE